MEIERTRAMRLAKEQADEAIEAAERTQLLMQKQELAAAAVESTRIAEQGTALFFYCIRTVL